MFLYVYIRSSCVYNNIFYTQKQENISFICIHLITGLLRFHPTVKTVGFLALLCNPAKRISPDSNREADHFHQTNAISARSSPAPCIMPCLKNKGAKTIYLRRSTRKVSRGRAKRKITLCPSIYILRHLKNRQKNLGIFQIF